MTNPRAHVRDASDPPSARDTALPVSFLEACERASVDPPDRQPLWRLHDRWRREGRSEEERLRELFEDYAHCRLYRASRQGDAAAAREFERHWRRYCRVYLGRSFRAELVDEIVSTFFARVYQRVGERFAWKCPFGIYLRSLLVNVTRDELGRLGRRRAREVPLAEEDTSSAYRSAAPTPEEHAIRRDRERALERGLLALEPIDRHIVRACLLDERAPGELAAELGMTRGAIYQRLYRSRKLLRAAVAGSAAGATRRAPSRRGVE